jgi:single-strand DNA-binding protein
MSQIGYVTLTGYVASDPRLHFTKNNEVPVASIRVGSTPRRVDRNTGEWRDGDTSYFTVKCWRKLAMNAKAALHKGDPVIVRGKFHTRTWGDEERPRTEVEIEADSIGHDLTFGWTHFNRGAHAQPGAMGELAQGEAIRQMAVPEAMASEMADLPDGAEGPGYFDDYEDGDPGSGAGLAAQEAEQAREAREQPASL